MNGDHPTEGSQSAVAFEAIEANFCEGIALVKAPFDNGLAAIERNEATTDIYQSILADGDALIDQWTTKCAEVLRSQAASPEVRATTNKVLACEIRNQAFAPLDRIVAAYKHEMADIGGRLDEMLLHPSDARADHLLSGALTGRLMGGLGPRGDFMATVGGLVGAGGARMESLSQQLHSTTALIDRMLVLRTAKSKAFFDALPIVARDWADYSTTKIFGASIDLAKQQALAGRLEAIARQASAHCYTTANAVQKGQAAKRQAELKASEKQNQASSSAGQGCLAILGLGVIGTLAVTYAIMRLCVG
jgi:hypothetical protein